MTELADEWRRLLAAMPDGIVISDPEGRIVFVNQVLEELTGYAAGDLIGQPVEVLVPESLHHEHVAHRSRYRRAGFPPRPMGAGLDIHLRRADGTEVPVDIALSPLETGDGPLVVSAVRDVTERKRAEAVIRESERRWSEMLENVQLAVVGLDLDGRVDYVNPFFLDLTGYRGDEVAGLDWFEHFLPDRGRQEARAVFANVVTGRGGRYYEHEVLTKSGQRRLIAWFNTQRRDPDGRPAGTLSVGEDITERQRAVARLRAMSEVTQAILDGADTNVVLRAVARNAARLVGADLGTVATLTGDGTEMVVRAAEGADATQLEGRTFPVEESVSGEVMATGTSLVFEDISADPHGAQPVVAVGSVGPAIVVPLWLRGQPVGTLLVANERDGWAFDAEDLRLVESFAAQASVAYESAQAREELRRLAVVEERERIARELHDTVIQRLFATGMSLQATAGGAPDTDARVQRAVDELDEVIREIRSTIFALESAHRPGRTLRAGVLHLVEEWAPSLGFRPHIRFEGPVDAAVSDAVAEHLLATLREALSNVARHAGATRVDVLLRAGDDLLLRVVDDGVGIGDVAEGTGRGLRNMARRAEELGGRMVLTGPPGGGTVLEWYVPLAG